MEESKTAVHEASHALIAHKLGMKFRKAKILEYQKCQQNHNTGN